MLKYLAISNFALIERLQLTLGPGLNVLTGETGSGKSLLLDSLGVLTGSKAGAPYIRAGKPSASIEAAFEIDDSESSEIAYLLDAAGIHLEPDTELIVRREITSGGRSRVFVNERLTTVAFLKQLQPLLTTIQSQGEQLELQDKERQLTLLDSYAGIMGLREGLAGAYANMRKAERRLSELDKRLRERVAREDYLRFQLDEISSLKPEIGEDERLVAERSAVANAERISALTADAYSLLYENDDSVLNKLGHAERELLQLAQLDERVRHLVDEFSVSRVQLQDISESLRHYASSIELSEGRLDELENRLADLERLKRKHGTDLQGVLNIQVEIMGELSASDGLERERDALVGDLLVLREEYLQRALEVSARRHLAAKEFAERVEKELETVALEKARFQVNLKSPETGNGFQPDSSLVQRNDQAAISGSESGIDEIEFLFSANPGEPLKPLSETASGGELSRLFLVLYTLEGAPGQVEARSGVVVFDEIDVGIGGRVAEAVGRRLKDLAHQQQVLCVTHQPQIARFADTHLAVSKQTDGDRTRTFVKEIHGEDRVLELVRMVGGKDDAENRRVVDLIFQTGENRTKKRRGAGTQAGKN
jgi:DNA repair protein RecN (Recombination protein N)